MNDPNSCDICPLCQEKTMPKWSIDGTETARCCSNLPCGYIQKRVRESIR